MVFVELGSSAILVEPIKDRSSEELNQAYLHFLGRVKATGMHPKKHIMDNEVSEVLNNTILDNFKLELEPPGCHRRNMAEVAIEIYSRSISSLFWQVCQSPSQSNHGASSCCRQRSH